MKQSLKCLVGLALIWTSSAFGGVSTTVKDYSLPMNCNVGSINDGYSQDHYDDYMFCQQDFDRIMREAQQHYKAIIKIEGLDGLAINLLSVQPRTLGEDCHTQLKIRIVGVEDDNSNFQPSRPQGPTNCDQPREP